MECGDAYAGPKCPLQAIVVHKKKEYKKDKFIRSIITNTYSIVSCSHLCMEFIFRNNGGISRH